MYAGPDSALMYTYMSDRTERVNLPLTTGQSTTLCQQQRFMLVW